nr:type I-E CRISPR-associated protein Cas6/Cse3/CasE [uncultured Halomonas sp.]
MYLSRIRIDLNGLDRVTLFEVLEGGAYGSHQLLWKLFPEHEGPRPFLFRQEMESDQLEQGQAPKGLPLYYLLSDREPIAVPGLLDAQSKPFAPRLGVGDRLAFRLRANPTIARREEGKKSSKRSDVLMHAKSAFSPGQRTAPECIAAMDHAAREWLKSRAEGRGFALIGAPEVDAYRQHELHKATRRDAVQFSSVDYEGLLEVTDPGQLIETLAHGLGRAKAFGCGLMLVRPAP